MMVREQTVSLRAAVPGDEEAICSVHVRAIRETAAPWYQPKQIEAWAGSLKPETYGRAIAAARLFVAEESGAVVGVGHFDVATGRIVAIYVSPEAQGRGVGRALVAEALRRAAAAGLSRVTLESSINAAEARRECGCQGRDYRRRGGVGSGAEGELERQ
jgi:GNAT superfamily N-acetyltransferase